MNIGRLSKRVLKLPNDVSLAGGLALLTILSRLPFTSQIMYHWDCINFALALDEFNLAKEQPHPPGYILYVYLGRLVNVFIPDKVAALTFISVVSSALAVVALFYLGRSVFDRWVGLIGALLLASSPLFWFYGEISLPHPLDAFLTILAAWWLYQVLAGRHQYLIPVAVLLAVIGGFRQQTFVMLIPLALFAVRKEKLNRLLLATVVGAILCLGWFIPLTQSQGGLKAYLEISSTFSDRFMATTSVLHGADLWGVRRNLIKLGTYTLYAWNLALIPALLYVGLRLRQHPRAWNWEKVFFFLLWIVPFGLFYALIHMGQQGLIFVFLPALCLISAASLVRLWARRPRWLAATVILLLAANVAIFCLAPEQPLGGERFRLLTRATLANSDRYYLARLNSIEENFAPERTAILAANWRHVMYYLPAYTWLPYDIVSKWELGEGQAQVEEVTGQFSAADLGLSAEAEQIYVILFDPNLQPFNQSPERTSFLPLSSEEMPYLTLNKGELLSIATDGIRVVGNP
jgi:4-amino-4-deoxy-L-arabinose transferase-like glycosyltransferase